MDDRTVTVRARRAIIEVAVLAALMGARTSDAQSAGAANSAAPARVQALVGCYRLALGPWSAKIHGGPPMPTTMFRLDSTELRNGQPGERAATRLAPAELLAPGDPRAPWRLLPARWRMFASDSVEVAAWLTGTEAEVFFGRAVGRDLRGVVRRTTDAIPMNAKTGRIMWDVYPSATATATRVDCP